MEFKWAIKVCKEGSYNVKVHSHSDMLACRQLLPENSISLG